MLNSRRVQFTIAALSILMIVPLLQSSSYSKMVVDESVKQKEVVELVDEIMTKNMLTIDEVISALTGVYYGQGTGRRVVKWDRSRISIAILTSPSVSLPHVQAFLDGYRILAKKANLQISICVERFSSNYPKNAEPKVGCADKSADVVVAVIADLVRDSQFLNRANELSVYSEGKDFFAEDFSKTARPDPAVNRDQICDHQFSFVGDGHLISIKYLVQLDNASRRWKFCENNVLMTSFGADQIYRRDINIAVPDIVTLLYYPVIKFGMNEEDLRIILEGK